MAGSRAASVRSGASRVTAASGLKKKAATKTGTKKKKKVVGKKKKKGGKASILKPSATARQREALIAALRQGRSSGSLIGAPEPSGSATDDAGEGNMASPSARSRAGSVASRARSRVGSVAFGSPSRARSVAALSTSPTKRKKSALAKGKGPTSQQLAQQLFAATTDTALGAEVQILRAALSTLTNTVVEEVSHAAHGHVWRIPRLTCSQACLGVLLRGEHRWTGFGKRMHR